MANICHPFRFSIENNGKTAENVKTMGNVIETTENIFKTTENVIKTTENVVKTTENAVKTMESSPNFMTRSSESALIVKLDGAKLLKWLPNNAKTSSNPSVVPKSIPSTYRGISVERVKRKRSFRRKERP